MGAEAFLLSTDDAVMTAARSFDVIISTIPVRHDVAIYIPLLDIEGVLVTVGQVGPIDDQSIALLITGRRRITGSFIGGTAETQEMLEFCAESRILPECESIKMEEGLNANAAHPEQLRV